MKRILLTFGLVCLFSAGNLGATVFFLSNMESGAGWGVNSFGDGDHAATFGYDYSADGIPEAPHTMGGDAATTGLKLEANQSAPDSAAGFTVYPMGQSFSGNFQLRFDAWMSYDVNERVNGGASGTTEFLGGGVGYDSASADIGSGAQAIATGDGGSGNDWRVFKDGFFVPATAMPAGSRNGSDPYYSDFLPGVAPPAGQLQAAFDPGIVGSPGFQWITWLFTVVNNGVDVARVDIDIMKPGGESLRIASLDCLDTTDSSTGCTSQGNISLFYADFFSSVTPRPDLTFGLIDNVIVTDELLTNPTVPEPTSLTLFGLGLAGLIFAGRRSRK
ncbi:MAG: PEP-CTERM sorting domain-containing protein [Bryobacterales bacterium]|nr:PEP-CTERM sorting domain-containing protein [Acidobacteriota bacterium]MCB9383755.1 PEP-CTERM sorting domain-containing protein [Bryobacterales bacterium]